ncbi:MAG: hypothetical protein H5T44_01755 [Thermoplasmatales archaeon]|nr:hypothetical protein [Thermoplasmatales archaeon]
MIGLITENFSFYYDIVDLLKRRKIPFITLSYEDNIPSSVDVIITSDKKKLNIKFDKIICYEEGCNIDKLIDKAILLMSKNKKLLFGIDPGEKIGIAVYSGVMLIKKFVTKDPKELILFIKEMISEAGAEEVVVKVGNGGGLIRNRIINLLQDENLLIQIVDESDIQSFDDDAISACKIAMTPGKEIKYKMSVEPKEGEIKNIQRLSRLKSKNITISKELARKVLIGEISLEEAIEFQKRS